MAFPFEFVVNSHPVSQQARRRSIRDQWVQSVRSHAEQHWPTGENSTNDPVMLTINYVYDRHNIDVDNLPKPILDALKKLVFDDDSQVTDLLCHKRYRPNNPDSEFVHIIVEESPD